MKKFIFITFTAVLFAWGCKQDGNSKSADQLKSDKINEMSGYWVSIDFCSRAHQYGSVLAAINNAAKPYAMALAIDPAQPDSVFCYNGVKSWSLPLSLNVDTIEMKHAAPNGRSVYLVYNSQSEKDMTMYDGTEGSTNLSTFIKSKATVSSPFAAFRIALNHSLFDGQFSMAAAKSAAGIQFLPAGNITGWPEYDSYEVCTGGDCFVTGSEMDIITLSKAKAEGSERILGFKYNNYNDTLRLYNLEAPADGKSAYGIKNVAYTLARKTSK